MSSKDLLGMQVSFGKADGGFWLPGKNEYKKEKNGRNAV